MCIKCGEIVRLVVRFLGGTITCCVSKTKFLAVRSFCTRNQCTYKSTYIPVFITHVACMVETFERYRHQKIALPKLPTQRALLCIVFETYTVIEGKAYTSNINIH